MWLIYGNLFLKGSKTLLEKGKILITSIFFFSDNVFFFFKKILNVNLARNCEAQGYVSFPLPHDRQIKFTYLYPGSSLMSPSLLLNPRDKLLSRAM